MEISDRQLKGLQCLLTHAMPNGCCALLQIDIF